MNRDDCLQSLNSIQATLEMLAQTANGSWDTAKRRWVSADGEIYDFTGTLADTFKDNDIRHLLRWIEFHVDDGPARRARLASILRTLRDEIGHIENGNRSNPFRWARESIDDAAAKVACELQQVADYVGDLVRLVEPQLTINEARSRFCFEEWQDGKTYKEINVALKHHSEWEHFEDEKAVRGPIESWGKRIGVEPRKGQRGRRAKT